MIFILPVSSSEPVKYILPVNINVSALLENIILPLSPVALKFPDTTSEPEITTA